MQKNAPLCSELQDEPTKKWMAYKEENAKIGLCDRLYTVNNDELM